MNYYFTRLSLSCSRSFWSLWRTSRATFTGAFWRPWSRYGRWIVCIWSTSCVFVAPILSWLCYRLRYRLARTAPAASVVISILDRLWHRLAWTCSTAIIISISLRRCCRYSWRHSLIRAARIWPRTWIIICVSIVVCTSAVYSTIIINGAILSISTGRCRVVIVWSIRLATWSCSKIIVIRIRLCTVRISIYSSIVAASRIIIWTTARATAVGIITRPYRRISTVIDI